MFIPVLICKILWKRNGAIFAQSAGDPYAAHPGIDVLYRQRGTAFPHRHVHGHFRKDHRPAHTALLTGSGYSTTVCQEPVRYAISAMPFMRFGGGKSSCSPINVRKMISANTRFLKRTASAATEKTAQAGGISVIDWLGYYIVSGIIYGAAAAGVYEAGASALNKD